MNKDCIVLGFSDYREQGNNIANRLSIDYQEVRTHYFPDGEVSVTLPPALPSEAIICRSLNQPNDKLIELLLTCKTARELGVKHITLIAPYLCYMRQDKAFHPGEAVSQKIVGELLAGLVDTLITVDPHLHRTASLDQVLPATKNVCLSAAPLIGKFIAQNFKDVMIIGPDEESLQWVSTAAEKAGCPFAIAKKTRHGDKDVVIELPGHNFSGKDIILLDDIISSGHTIAQTAKALKNTGAGKIYTIVTHALCGPEIQELLMQNCIEKVWSTDSVISKTNTISLAGLISTAFNHAN
jgi:ribose-phosphate pyrophosphokinase